MDYRVAGESQYWKTKPRQVILGGRRPEATDIGFSSAQRNARFRETEGPLWTVILMNEYDISKNNKMQAYSAHKKRQKQLI